MAKKKQPTKREVKNVLGKAEKKITDDKLDLVLSKLGTIEGTLGTYTKKTDQIEKLFSEKDTADQKAQGKLSSEEQLKKIEAEQAKEKTQGKQQPGQTQRQPTPEEKALGATVQFQQDTAQAQAAQTQAQEQGQQPQPGQVLTPQGAWLLERASHAAEIILPAFFQSKGSSGGNPLKGFFDELKIYQGIEHTVLDGFFNYMKMLSPNLRQNTMDNIARSTPRPTMTNLPGKSEIIE